MKNVKLSTKVVKVVKVVISKNVTRDTEDYQFVTVDIHTEEEWPSLIQLELKMNNRDVRDGADILHLLTLRSIKKLRSVTELSFENRRTEDIVHIIDGDDVHYEFVGVVDEVQMNCEKKVFQNK